HRPAAPAAHLPRARPDRPPRPAPGGRPRRRRPPLRGLDGAPRRRDVHARGRRRPLRRPPRARRRRVGDRDAAPRGVPRRGAGGPPAVTPPRRTAALTGEGRAQRSLRRRSRSKRLASILTRPAAHALAGFSSSYAI